MTQSDIKRNAALAIQRMAMWHQELKQLQAVCQHPNVAKVPLTAVVDCKCPDCKKVWME